MKVCFGFYIFMVLVPVWLRKAKTTVNYDNGKCKYPTYRRRNACMDLYGVFFCFFLELTNSFQR